MKKFAEKLRSDKKTQAAVICGSVGAVIVLAAAITIPVTLHNRISVEKHAAQAAVSTESVTAEITTAAQAATEPETTQSVEATTVAPTTSTANNNSGNSGGSGSSSSKSSGSSKSTGSGGSSKSSSGNSSSSGGSSSSQSSGSQNPNSKPADKPAQANPNKKVWTQAEVDSVIAEAKSYAQSKGFTINSNKGLSGTTWSTPILTEWNTIAKVKSDCIYDIDFFCEKAIAELGSVTGSINIFAEKYTDSDGDPQWEIYVVR